MAIREVTFDDYEGNQYEEYTGEDPRPGWYTAEVVKAEEKKDDDQVMFICVIRDHDVYAGWARAWYGSFDGNTKWKLQDIIRAIRNGDDKTTLKLDWANEAKVKAFLKKYGGFIKIQVGPYNENMTIRKVRPMGDAAAPAKTAAKTSAPVIEDEPDDEEVEPYTEQELTGVPLAELKAILKDEFEYTAAELKAVRNSKAAIAAILEAQEEDEEEETDEVETDDSDDEEFEDGFDDGEEEEEEEAEEEPEPEPAPRRRATKKAAPAKAAPAPATTVRRRRKA